MEHLNFLITFSSSQMRSSAADIRFSNLDWLVTDNKLKILTFHFRQSSACLLYIKRVFDSLFYHSWAKRRGVLMTVDSVIIIKIKKEAIALQIVEMVQLLWTYRAPLFIFAAHNGYNIVVVTVWREMRSWENRFIWNDGMIKIFLLPLRCHRHLPGLSLAFFNATSSHSVSSGMKEFNRKSHFWMKPLKAHLMCVDGIKVRGEIIVAFISRCCCCRSSSLNVVGFWITAERRTTEWYHCFITNSPCTHPSHSWSQRNWARQISSFSFPFWIQL